jgi:hypothetical protein
MHDTEIRHQVEPGLNKSSCQGQVGTLCFGGNPSGGMQVHVAIDGQRQGKERKGNDYIEGIAGDKKCKQDAFPSYLLVADEFCKARRKQHQKQQRLYGRALTGQYATNNGGLKGHIPRWPAGENPWPLSAR